MEVFHVVQENIIRGVIFWKYKPPGGLPETRPWLPTCNWTSSRRGFVSLELYFLKSLLESLKIENRSLCSRGWGQEGRFWDYSVMKWLSKNSKSREKSMLCISSEARFRESWRKLILEWFPTFWTYQNAINMNSRPVLCTCGVGWGGRSAKRS